MMRRVESAGLSYGQVFLLIVGFGIASALIFLFGIWVGRDVAERRLVQEERVVRLPMPAQPTPSAETKQGAVDVSFYQSLKEKAYQRETAVAASPTAARVAQVDTPTPLPTNTAPRPTPPRTPAVPPKHTEPPARVERPERADVWADAGWTVQVNATTDSQQAMNLARALKAKGYDAYTLQAPMRGQTWYRVRVGRFASREKAKELENRLRTTEGMEGAYVAPQ
jgi:cell division septation protein DedD